METDMTSLDEQDFARLAEIIENAVAKALRQDRPSITVYHTAPSAPVAASETIAKALEQERENIRYAAAVGMD